MGSTFTSSFSYQRLKEERWFDDDFDEHIGRLRHSSTFRLRRVHVRRRLKVKIPSLRRFLRRKARSVKLAWTKVVKRLKESQSHFGDLFAGNYLFLQVTPTPLKSNNNVHKSLKPYCINHDLAPTSIYSLPKVAY
ncbi:unnamed protein product [Coffea canephora]|uniref:Uncharacterized protein n=1 Tax=Coffea canephora TaxID=49390 RepID=A0A068VFA8_COFCA|nr:unnamed protein product [Coffea canephora]